MFKNYYGLYKKRNMCNFNDSRMGNSAERHAMYSEGRNEVMGFITPIFTLQGAGVGACERGWGVIKRIKPGQRSKLTGVKTKKLSKISTTQNLNKARINREALREL